MCVFQRISYSYLAMSQSYAYIISETIYMSSHAVSHDHDYIPCTHAHAYACIHTLHAHAPYACTVTN